MQLDHKQKPLYKSSIDIFVDVKVLQIAKLNRCRFEQDLSPFCHHQRDRE